jgi:hypothetical protein
MYYSFEIKQCEIKVTKIAYFLVRDIHQHTHEYMVFDLCSYRNNSLDSAIESIVWINIIDTVKLVSLLPNCPFFLNLFTNVDKS